MMTDAPPRCQQCGKVTEGANRLSRDGQWALKTRSNRCRQAAFRAAEGRGQ